MPKAEVVEQRERRGTAHAVLQAERAIGVGHKAIVVLFGDTPLFAPKPFVRLRMRCSRERRLWP